MKICSRFKKNCKQNISKSGEAFLQKIGRDKLLWMMIEAGEVADIIKKKGDDAILNDPETRHHFTEEVCDVLMYLNDVLLCYGITPNEVENVYLEKHKRNMSRW